MSESPSDQARRRRGAEKIQRQLDEALEASFPASDPVAIVTSHEEEDWGIEPLAPAAPSEPALPAEPAPPSERTPAGKPARRQNR